MSGASTNGAEALVERINAIAESPFERATAMPPAVYTAAELLALEQDRIFGRDWICVGRADEIPNPGDYLTYAVNDQPIFVIRGKDDSVRTFANVCLHRMMRLLQGAGNCNRIVCPYHAWTYGIDGQLTGAPNMRHVPGFDTADFRLPEVRTEIWEGWIYVTLADDVPSIAERLAALQPLVARYRMAKYRHVIRQDHVWNTNWKLLTENFMEGYHLPVAHRETVGAWFPARDTEFPMESGDSFAVQTFKKSDAATYGQAHPGNKTLKGKWRTTSVMPTVFPAHMYVLAPDHLWYLSLRPQGVDRVHVRFGAAVAPEVLEAQTDAAAFVDQIAAFFDSVNAEDRFIVEGIYEGVRGGLSTGGPLNWLEWEIHEFIKYLSRRLADDRRAVAA